MMIDILLVSASVSVMILIMLILTPLLKKRYSAKWRYIIWLLLAVRLVIPIRFEPPLVTLNLPARTDASRERDYGVYTEPPRRASENITAAEDNAERFLPEAQNGKLTASAGIFDGIDPEMAALTVWAAAAGTFFLWHIISYIVFRRRIKPYREKISRRVYRCGKIESPIMIGFFRPEILIPDADYTDEELEIIIAHEMTHCKRRDMWYKLLILAANAMHWFNPLVYIMARCADRDLEYSCDEAVVRGRDAEFRKAYSRVILKTIRGKRE